MIISHFPGGGGKVGDLPFNEIFQYSGNASFIDDGEGNWRIKFLSSGTLTVAQDVFVDIFAVGGGGNGAEGYNYASNVSGCSGSGGGGGYTSTMKNIKLSKGAEYTVTVGAATGASSIIKVGESIAVCEAAGGNSGKRSGFDGATGGDGGSGGGPGVYSASSAKGSPGSDGSDGSDTVYSGVTKSAGGKGQGTTTREFGEDTGDLYGGGGGGGFGGNQASVPGAAGGGGGGATKTTAAENGAENTGGGGGGGGYVSTSTTGVTTHHKAGGKGGSGIVIIRNFRAVTA